MNKPVSMFAWLLIRWSVLVYLALFLGCARVKPYERENLGNPIMQRTPDVIEEGMKSHNRPRREGSAGGSSGSGGGCGC